MKQHTPWCEAEGDHDHDCAAATELTRLRAFTEAVRETFACTAQGEDKRDDHVDDCFHCYADQALERAR